MHNRLLITLVAMLLTTLITDAAAQTGQRVDLLILGGTIVTMDASRRVIEDGAIAVAAGRIVALGPRNDITSADSTSHPFRANSFSP